MLDILHEKSFALGFVSMISGAMLVHFSLPDREGRRPYLLTRGGLTMIYPAIILALLAIGPPPRRS
jgi:hypothetical protein